MNTNATSSFSQPAMIHIQQASTIPSTAIAGQPPMAQTVHLRKRTHPESLIPYKRRRQVLLDITNSNIRREGTNKRIIKESTRQKAAREDIGYF